MIATPVRFGSRRVPLGRDQALPYLPWVFALFVVVAALAGLALVMIDDARRGSQDSGAIRLTVQVPANASDARLQTLLAALRQTPGVGAVNLLSAAEVARLLEPWLGAPVPLGELPVPRLIDVAINPGEAIDIVGLRQQLAPIVPEVRVDGHEPGLSRQRASLQLLRGWLFAAIGAALLGGLLLAAYTSGAALAARRSEVELLHLLGAADGDIAGAFAARAVGLALLGGAIAAIAVAATILALGAAVPRLPPSAIAIGVNDWRLWAVLTGAAAAVAIVATLGALAIALHRLRRLTEPR